MKDRPKKSFRVGYVTAAVWDNDTFYTVTLNRSYKDGDEWKNTDGLGAGDLLNAAKALERAEDWINNRE